MIINKEALWPLDSEIHVKFLNGEENHKNMVKKYAVEWEELAAVKFIFDVDDHSDSQIKISFNDKGDNRSCVGECKAEITMHLDLVTLTSEETMRGIILHEFGHALGLEHEHQHPENSIVWTRDKVYEYFENKKWSRTDVDKFIFEKFSHEDKKYFFLKYDKNSIMHYFILNDWTEDDFEVNFNSYLSELDKEKMKLVTAIRQVNAATWNVLRKVYNEGDPDFIMRRQL
ncbi:M12 family metallopeptidase [Cytobacillus pseudoceanisediminis]|uniref:M12 family metallopeptidase n=1 Tax=Cytobacillus pseudoceanisediminis TaxID=3051614 RepID=UPI003C2C4D92